MKTAVKLLREKLAANAKNKEKKQEFQHPKYRNLN